MSSNYCPPCRDYDVRLSSRNHPSDGIRPAFRAEVPRGSPARPWPPFAGQHQQRGLDVVEADLAVARHGRSAVQQDPALDRHGVAGEPPASSSTASADDVGQLGESALRQLVEPLAVLTGQGTRPARWPAVTSPRRRRSSSGRTRAGSGCAGCRGRRWSRPRPRSRPRPSRYARKSPRETSSSGRMTAPAPRIDAAQPGRDRPRASA